MRNFFPTSFKQSLDLDSYIKVEEFKDGKGQIASRFVRFNLDANLLDKILQARAKQQNVGVSRRLLGELRSYALLDADSCLQPALTFCTDYSKSVSQKPVSENLVMRSVISLDGDIIHQIRHDCLKDSTWCLAIATAHYWLIDQLLNQLQIKTVLLFNSLSWGLSLLTVALTLIHYLEQLNPLTLLASAVMSWLFQQGYRYLLRLLFPPLRRWLLRQLLFRLLSPNQLEKKIAKVILGWFVP